MKTKAVLISTVLLLAVLLSACGAAIAPAGQPSVRSLNVSGTGKVTLKPDIAYINIGVHTENPIASDGMAKNNADSQAVIAALKAAGVAVDDIQTTNFNIYPSNQTDINGKITGTTYIVDNTVNVTVREIAKLGAALDAVVKAGANNINSIQFDLADKTKALSQARAAAVKAARAEADELAAAAGVTLGSIQSINYNENTPGPIFYGKGGGMALTDAAAPISAGTMEISVNVAMTYEIK